MNKKGPSPRSKAPERVTVKVIEASSAAEDAALEQEAPAALVPKLRFPEFQTAEGWVAESLGEMYSFKGNNSLSREKLNYTGGSVKNLHYGDIHTKFSTHFDIRKEAVPFINETESSTIREENFCIEGDMVFADASEDLDDIGKSIEIIALNGEKVVSGLHTILARRTSDCIAIGFGGHLFKSAFVRSQIQREAQGSKVLGISGTRLRNLILPLPPTLSEQQRIADCLTSLDELIAAQGRKLDALKNHKSGLMQQLFPREGETVPSLRFPEFQDAGEWEFKTLGEVCDIQRGKFSHRPRNDPRFFGGPYPFIQTGDVVKSEGGAVVASQSLNEEGLAVSKLFNPTIVLITIAANIGDTGLLQTAGCFTDSVVGLIPGTEVIPVFLELIMRGQKENLNKVATTGAQKNINNEILREVGILLPSLPEQHRIANCLTSLDELIAAEAQKLDALKTHKKGLMQQLFPTLEESL
jgi:type I restriction enzyme S subunit